MSCVVWSLEPTRDICNKWMPMLTLAMMMRMEMYATYLLMERTTIGFRGWTNLLGRGALLDAPEDRGPGPLLQWAGGGLHGGAENGSKQVLTGGDQGTSLVLEIEDPLFLNVPRCWPGVSQDDFLWTRAISWKTTNDAPLIPAIETGNRSTMICITCRYKVSIRTQVLQGRVSTKFVNPYLTKPTPRRVCRTSIKKLSRRQILLDKANTEKEEVQEDSPSGKRNESKEVLRLGKEYDEVTVVLETEQTKKQIVAYQDLDCWNLL